MTKKKDENQDQNKDLTRIEDLSEFLHQKDSDLDSQFEGFSPDFDKATSATGISLDTLDEEAPPEIPMELPSSELESESLFEASSLDEVSFETTEEIPTEDFSLEENNFGEDAVEDISFLEQVDESETQELPDNLIDSSNDVFSFDSNESTLNDDLGDSFSTSENQNQDDEEKSEVLTSTPERFEDVKTFANNFSYGQVQGGGNPPFSIIVRHIKFAEEAEDIVNLLKEFGIVTDSTEKETLMAIELGSLIIPQISEYTAIVLSHKLRRFDLDLEVGLSDEVHPSKSGETNPRGLIKKDNLRQNKTESLNLSEIDNSIKDIIISTMSSVQGYKVESYIGVQTTFSIVEEAELEKLQYVQRSNRENSELYEFENTEPTEMTSEKAFKDYQNSFSLIYEDLTMQLKQKAFAQNANALLGLSFQLSPLNFERAHLRISAYQITCSATLAIISKETT